MLVLGTTTINFAAYWAHDTSASLCSSRVFSGQVRMYRVHHLRLASARRSSWLRNLRLCLDFPTSRSSQGDLPSLASERPVPIDRAAWCLFGTTITPLESILIDGTFFVKGYAHQNAYICPRVCPRSVANPHLCLRLNPPVLEPSGYTHAYTHCPPIFSYLCVMPIPSPPFVIG